MTEQERAWILGGHRSKALSSMQARGYTLRQALDETRELFLMSRVRRENLRTIAEIKEDISRTERKLAELRKELGKCS